MEYQVHEIGLTYKKLEDRTETILSSKIAFEFIKPFFEPYNGIREAVFCIYLNHANQIIGVQRISEGGISGASVDVKIVFKGALNILASSIILVHNHPTGTLNASVADKDITSKIKEACKFLDLQLLDHIIIGSDTTFYSFADSGIL